MSALKRIPYTMPSITQLEIDYSNDAVTNGWGPKCYEYIDLFEAKFREHLNVNFALSTSSCTGAMHMGLKALGIKPGDEVIMADTNWIATAAPVMHLGAKPVFVDIDPITWCIDPAKTKEAITDKTKAIIATHLYGQLCDMDALITLGNDYNIPIVEDAAEAIGSIYKNQRAGSIGCFGVFSFHGTKTLTTGEGGMIVTNDEALYDHILTLSNHGRNLKQVKQFWPDEIGFKYKISNVQAAIGCAQLSRIDELISRKQEIITQYRHNLEGAVNCTMNAVQQDCVIGGWMPNVVFNQTAGITREMLISSFSKANIDARVFFYPLSQLEFFESNPGNKNSWEICERAINLPSYHNMTSSEIERVCNVLSEFVKNE